MQVSKGTRVTMFSLMCLDLLYFFLVPFLIIKLGMPIIFAIGAGLTLGFFQPSLGAYHEYNHNSHSLSFIEEWVYKIVTCTMLLGPLDIHHKYFHHRYANTDDDLGIPKKNRSYYVYQWLYCAASTPKLFKAKPWKMTWSVLGFFGSVALQAFLFGPIGIAYQLANIIAFHWSTGAGNYVQHYGLDMLPLSRSERLGYAWDNKGKLSKYVAFNIHIHSDHHIKALKPCDKLENIKGRPINPYPLPAMMFLAMIPPLYFRIMNPRLEEYIKRIS